MQLISKYSKILFTVCVVNIFSKSALVIPLKDRNGIAITNAFQKILDKYNRKPKKLWADKRSEFSEFT